jgi:DNA polymerase-1
LFAQLRAFEYQRDDPRHRVIRTVPEFQNAIHWLAQQPTLAVDTETSGLAWYRDASVCGVAMGAMREGAPQCFYFPVRHQTGEVQLPPDIVFAAVRDILANPALETIWHNKKFDQHMLRRERVHILGRARDTMVEAQLADENAPLALKARALADLGDKRAHAFEDTLDRAVGRLAKEAKCKKTEFRDRYGYARVDVMLAGIYACWDIDFTLGLANTYDRRGIRQFFRNTYETEIALIDVLCEMEENGMPVNRDYLEWLAGETDAAKDALLPQIHAAAGGYVFRPEEDAEVVHVLTKRLGVQLTKETKASKKARWNSDEEHVPVFTVDAEVLGALAAEHPVCKLILDYREAAKIRGTYTTSIIERIGHDGNVHGDFKQLGTNTGRMSSEKPNLQNVSSDSNDRAIAHSGLPLKKGGQDPWSIKRAFTNRGPGKRRIYNDYSQIELRVLAYYSRDPVMMETYLDPKGDIHTRTSMEVFGSADEEMRRDAKVINFGLSYCMSAIGYARNTGKSEAQGEEDMERFFRRYGRIEPFREEFWRLCRQNGAASGTAPHFQNMFGRPRRIPDLNSRNKWERMRAERQAIGSLIQGTAAELTKESLVRIWRWEQKARTGLMLCSTIHDEISFDVDEVLTEPVLAAVVPMLETFPQFNPVPILVDSSYSDTDWSEKKKFKKGLVKHVWEPANSDA